MRLTAAKGWRATRPRIRAGAPAATLAGDLAGCPRRVIGAAIRNPQADPMEAPAHQDCPVGRAALPAVVDAPRRLVAPRVGRVGEHLATRAEVDVVAAEDARQAG